MAIFFLFAAFSGGAILLYLALYGGRAEPQYATVLPEPMPLPEFTMTRHDGNAFGRNDLSGKWHVVFFGFTNCPDICPATLQQLAIASNRAADAGDAFPGIVLVSVDPERDTPEALAAYVGNFGAGITGLTGDEAELQRLTKALGIFYGKSGDLDGNYSVDHSAAVLLINENAEWHAVFSAPHNIDNFVQDMPLLTGGG